MKLFWKNNKQKILVFIFCLLISFFTLLFTSKNSFLYPINDWVDANAFFTVGKSMFRGIVPYLELFEQKGILLYFIYGIGSLISYKTFVGVFIIEVLFWSAFLYFVYKIITLYLPKVYAFISIPFISFIIATSYSFTHGGSAEEFCFLFMIIPLYYLLKYFKEKEISYKNTLICGIMAGCAFLIKYTVMGFFFGVILFLFIDKIIHRRYKEAFLHGFAFLGGMIIPIGIALVYLGFNNAIVSFFNTYFYLNLTAYPAEVATLSEKFIRMNEGVLGLLFLNGPIISVLLLLYPFLICFIKTNKKHKLYLILTYIFTLLVIFMGLKFYRYYILPLFIFICLSIVGIFSIVERFIKLEKYKKLNISLVIISSCTCLFLSYFLANDPSFRNKDKTELFQYAYADIINSYDNPTLLNIGDLDCGLYLTTGIIPNTYFFELQNFLYDKFPDNIDSFNRYIDSKDTMFIILYTKKDLEDELIRYPNLLDNYELLESRIQDFEEDVYLANLYIAKEGV